MNAELTALSKAGRWDRMAESITDDMVDAFAVVAAVHELPRRPADRFGGLLTRLSFAPPRDMPDDEMADLVRRIRQACADVRISPGAATAGRRDARYRC